MRINVSLKKMMIRKKKISKGIQGTYKTAKL